MKKYTFSLFFLLPCLLLAWQNVQLQVINYPEFNELSADSLNKQISRTDSLLQINFLTGNLFKQNPGDSTLAVYYDSLNFHYFMPTDYSFNYWADSLYFQILASNIEADSVVVLENLVVHADSMQVGIFGIYSPDYMVLNQVNSNVNFDYDVFEVAKKQAQKLQDCNIIIMFSNLGKYIDSDIVQNLPVDGVISFDYREQRDELFRNGRTYFYSVNGNQIGQLTLVYKNGKISKKWREIDF